MPRLLLKFNDEILKVIDSSKEFITIGRNMKNDIQIDNLAVSNFHAHIVSQLGHYFIEDLGSTNGTFVNERKIGKWALSDNDTITIGKHSIVFLDAEVTGKAVIEELQMDKTMILDTVKQRELLGEGAELDESPLFGPNAQLEVLSGNTDASTYELSKKLTLIGKDEMAEIRLKGMFAPKVGCFVSRDNSGYGLIPPEKRNKVELNGRSVTDAVSLKSGDQIGIGSVKLLFRLL
ncbi:MAG: FHA domain-containing protein [Desulfuromonadales bacterium]|nr:FHA domain-containing protein [Desulfuromonadales bacterium]